MPSRSGPILEAFSAACSRRGDDLALLSRGEGLRLSFAQLAGRVEDWTGKLMAAGTAEANQPVALAIGNRAAFVELIFALRRLDRPVVAIDGATTPERRLEICHRFGIGELIEAHGDDSDDIDVGDDLGQGLWHRRLPVSRPVELPPGTALVKLTSGSTGQPHGACFDEVALRAGIDQIAAAMELRASDRVLITIPLSHSYGFDNAVLSLAVVGTALVLEPSFFPQALLRAAHEDQATFLPLVPPLVRSLAQAEWPAGLALRRVICAGGALDPEAALAFRQASGLSVHNFYGSSETGGICFERRPEEPAATGTVGEPLPGVVVELDEGRVAVSSAANTLGSPGFPSRVAGTRVVTGDTAVWGVGGRLQLTGRSAEVLNVGGRKVPVAQIEDALLKLDGVHQAAVVGVADRARGDLSVAFLVTDRWPIDTAGLAVGLAPRRLTRLDKLPYDGRGKLDRRALRQQASTAISEGPNPTTGSSANNMTHEKADEK